MLRLLLVLHVPATRAGLQSALDHLTRMNVEWLRAHPNTPRLYDARPRVRWEREERDHVTGRRKEAWRTIREVLIRARAGRGSDCEDLGCYRAAELIVFDNERARAIPRESGVGWHIEVERENGSIEDPSALLGMGMRG